MLDTRSTNRAVVSTLDDNEATPTPNATVERRDRQGRDPVFSVETLMEGRSVDSSVFEDATPFLRP